MVKVKDILDYFELVAPFYMKFDFDNIGHLVGKLETEVSKVIVALDITDDVIDEAINIGANLIVSHHNSPNSLRYFSKCTPSIRQ